ncbi:tRNA (adenosine(37)-N6)-threonylcarbamoyltransferase complex ATPase subunit type 1 TsaE [Acetobacter oeni]|uniref:tRNA threonylcarbamoyladenosine biosynthesis protein TsaE n=1 Tax=Acetobacter oeni TaxID=304077 RepID=A0A511XQF7_9PROT|nr:tRNA (adenosine(37)-N6)-threonylcarbamoyltransferase complex ATPase subunit type 1 TsaE [Acetobacter oeni]MBB3883703.1 tRNA threonylcarbamoyladenosine biosynthesis protein TsaE [Acetobacter oeni]NHO19716.1 tRNA (adenosine(37)-N6)-threonylcarbamoyltransferase complex ATPase subunit type 1 TsaE [Acetobacter oeni]GBR06123.1 ATP/GTP hydrolase [Acetobacter oeni LMG 21952]GEN65177.1 tRNA (adenosine(37)-N6)-threonylcarbamoyltransferase complex ATPase subunit type 1 TsaE [Acetobacter oeni]
MTEKTLRLPTRAATEHLAVAIARATRPGDAILLSGPLGAGKSVFARAFLRELCHDPALDVPSPTFTLVQTYDATISPVAHFDLWRLDGPEALEELGWDDARNGVVLVEWPERLEDMTPPDALHIVLTPDAITATDETGTEDTPRTVTLTGWAARLCTLSPAGLPHA